MQHCVGARVQEARAGAQLFHLELDGARLTAQLNPDGRGGWQMKELAGEHNRRPTATERQRVHAWLRELPAPPALKGQPNPPRHRPPHPHHRRPS